MGVVIGVGLFFIIFSVLLLLCVLLKPIKLNEKKKIYKGEYKPQVDDSDIQKSVSYRVGYPPQHVMYGQSPTKE